MDIGKPERIIIVEPLHIPSEVPFEVPETPVIDPVPVEPDLVPAASA